MRDLDRALAEIGEIRSQMARGTQFRGYGPATFAVTGLMAVLAAAGQARWLPAPTADPAAYLWLWCGVATLSVAVIGFEMVARSRRIHTGLADEMIRSAVEQFLPAGVAGALLTAVLMRFAPQSLWMLPGLWQIVFGLGVFSSCRFLPRAMLSVGVWYLASGLFCLAFASGGQALAPWAMGAPFGVGQLLVAGVLLIDGGGRE
jgi:heme exporter protein D